MSYRWKTGSIVAVVAVLQLQSGCATFISGYRDADQASREAIDRLDRESATIAGERLELLSPYFPNFGVVNDEVYRGAEPDPNEIWRLRNTGFASVIDFRRSVSSTDPEVSACRESGLQYFNLPWSGHDEAVDTELVSRFLGILADPANLPAFIHCKRGAERTGTMLAVYRIEYDDWTSEDAFAEMNQYGFRSIWYPDLKTFVLDYRGSK